MLTAPQIGETPCGFCGGDECSTVMTTNRSHRSITSNCPSRYEFRYGSVKSTKSACTNVPIHCPHCDHQSHRLTLWKYNAIHHIETVHSDLVALGTSALDQNLLLDIQIGREEERKIGIPNESAEEFRGIHHILLLGSEDISSIESKNKPVKSESKRLKRTRAVLDSPNASGIPTKRKKAN